MIEPNIATFFAGAFFGVSLALFAVVWIMWRDGQRTSLVELRGMAAGLLAASITLALFSAVFIR